MGNFSETLILISWLKFFMKMKGDVILLKAFAIWVSFIPIAILNGLIREKALVPMIGQRFALPLSGISCALLFFLLTYLALPWLGNLKAVQYRVIGIGWFAMTVLFEFLFGILVAHKTWGELLQAYNILTGNLWLLVLAVVAVSPCIAARSRGLIE